MCSYRPRPPKNVEARLHPTKSRSGLALTAAPLSLLRVSLLCILPKLSWMKSVEAASHPKLTIDEFFEAISGADERYELINGVAYAMTGGNEGHNVICSNVLVAIVPAGKKSGCRTTSSDTAVQTGPNTVRYPDVVVD